MITLTTEQENWGFVSGQTSVLEGGLLPKDFFVSLASVEKLEDMLHRLQDTPLRDFITPGASWEEWNDIVDQHFCRQMREVRAGSPDGALAALFLLSGDYLNLKRAVLGLGSHPFEKNLFSEERLAAAAAGDFSLFPAETRQAMARLGGAAADEASVRAGIDLVLDGAYLRHMLALAAGLEVPLVSAYVSDFVLAKGVAALWRMSLAGAGFKTVEDLFLPVGDHTHTLRALAAAGDPKSWGALVPGRVGDLFRQAAEQTEEPPVQAFELLVANHLMEVARRGKLQTMGPERVAGYFVGLRAQVYNFKLVISGRFNGIDPEMLKRRLRECYV